MRIYFMICYVAVFIALIIFLDSRSVGVRADSPTYDIEMWVGHFFYISFAIGGFWAYTWIAEWIDESTRRWEWTGRILAFPILAGLWLGASLITTYIAATFTEIGRRIFFPYIPIHTHVAEYVVLVILGMALGFGLVMLFGAVLDRIAPEKK